MRRTALLSASTILALLLVCGAAFLGVGEQAQAAFPGENGRIAYMRGDGVVLDIYSTSPDGTDVRLETDVDPLLKSFSPAWSADGTKLAFVRYPQVEDENSASEIWIRDVESGQETRIFTTESLQPLLEPVASLSWSPDGAKLTFSIQKYEDNCGEVYVINSDGSGLTNITDTPAACELEPAWSPDGDKIAFSYFRPIGLTVWDVYVMNPDGTERVNLTNETTVPVANRMPNWSPDGTKLAFSRSSVFDNDVWVMSANGTGGVNLTNTPSSADHREVEVEPAWSPDGDKIAFRKVTNNNDIWVMNADGSGSMNLTNTPSRELDEYEPDWQPLPLPSVPERKADCKNGGYKEFGYKSQGRCVASLQRNAKATQ